MSRGLTICTLFFLLWAISVPAAGQLLGHWPLDEAIDGTTPDESGNGNNLTLAGSVSFVEGYYGQAASFGGDNADEDSITSEVDMDLFDPIAESLTVTAWVNQGSGDSSNAYEFIVCKGNATSGNVGWSIWTEGGSVLVRCNSSNTSAQRASQALTNFPVDEWVHVAMVIDRDAQQVRGYLNGSNEGWNAGGGGPSSDSLAGWGDIDTDIPLVVGQRNDGNGTLLGMADDVRVYAGALAEGEIQDAMAQIGKGQAREPMPEDEGVDVPYDSSLSWEAGEFAATHDVYLGTSFDDVNDAGRDNPLDVLVSQDQTGTTYDPAALEFGQTYYWRIDEVNGAPDYTIIKGAVWSFELEPLGYPIENIAATASSSATGVGPENTINGSGLDENDLHSEASSDMWLSGADGPEPVTIEYAFGRIYKLHQMLVWNYNVQFESILGYGMKDVTVEYSENGVDWLTLGDFEFAQGDGTPDYAAGTAIDFGGLAVQAVRLTAGDNWGTMTTQCGLSEVRFLYIPVQARKPEPADGQADVDADVVLSWRPGREAAGHEVYLSTDSAAVSAGTALIDTVSTNNLASGGLDLGVTYYWKVNEVNEAEAVSVWEGDLWSFTTQAFVTVDDFESYDNADNMIYDTWIDGWVNGNGSTVGYFTEPFAETSIVHGGRQSMPFEYINTAAPYYSEAERDLGGADWTAGGADTLRLYVYGSADNEAGTVYVAVEDTAGNVAVASCPDQAVVTTEAWQEWTIPYTDLGGVNLAAVQKVYVGVGDRDNPSAGGSGLIFIDDVAFGRSAVEE